MRHFSLGFIVLFLFQIGASAPQASAATKESSPKSGGSKARTVLSAVATPQSAGDQIVKMLTQKSSKASKSKLSSSKNIPAVKPVSSKGTASLKPGSVPPPPIPRTSVPQIRQEIQKILELNQKIKSVQGGRSSQLQRVQEQARIHQKILNELEASQKPDADQQNPAKSAILAQEKLRIIHEETQRNAQMVSELETIPTQSVSETAPKVKTSAS